MQIIDDSLTERSAVRHFRVGPDLLLGHENTLVRVAGASGGTGTHVHLGGGGVLLGHQSRRSPADQSTDHESYHGQPPPPSDITEVVGENISGGVSGGSVGTGEILRGHVGPLSLRWSLACSYRGFSGCCVHPWWRLCRVLGRSALVG